MGLKLLTLKPIRQTHICSNKFTSIIFYLQLFLVSKLTCRPSFNMRNLSNESFLSVTIRRVNRLIRIITYSYRYLEFD